MPTMLKLRSLQKRTVIYDKDDKRSDFEQRNRENKKLKKGRFLLFFFNVVFYRLTTPYHY